MKKIAVYSLVGLFILSCSVSAPNNSTRDSSSLVSFTRQPSLKDFNFAELEKEYKTFSSKALSDAYVSRMCTKFLVTTPNPTQIIRQFEFARYLKDIKSDSSYFNSLTGIISNDSTIYTKINTMPEIVSYKTANPATFGTFVDSLSPIPTGFKLVEKGTFDMGSPTGIGNANERPVHSVNFTKDLYMSEKEVTQGEWTLVYNAGTTTSALKSLMHNTADPSYFPVGGNNPDFPVEMVSWEGAIGFCNAKSLLEGIPVAYNTTTGELLDGSGNVTTDTTMVKGYRLPTEAEWEYAAKGGNKPSFCGANRCLYSGSNTPEDVAWYPLNSDNMTHQVGTKAPNELGLYDMTGNVTEWTTDKYLLYSSNPATNPYISTGDPSRVHHGGGWPLTGYGSDVRVSLRFASNIATRSSGLGFRLARTVP